MKNDIKAISVAIQADVPILIWGPPGVGKSAAINSLTESLSYNNVTLIASLHEPSDFLGLPVVNGQNTRFVPPEWVDKIFKAHSSGMGSVVFFDEISCAPPAVQAALLRIILEKHCGQTKLPESTRFVAAANPPDIAAGGWDLSPPLANRFVHLEWVHESSEWIDMFSETDGFRKKVDSSPDIVRLPENWEDTQEAGMARSMLASYLRARQHMIFSFPKTESEASRAWPSPRSWTMASKLFSACRSAGLDFRDSVTMDLIAGCVSSGQAYEFLAWAETLDIPDPEFLLKNPNKFEVPGRADLAMTIILAVADRVIKDPFEGRWEAFFKMIEKMIDADCVDIAAVAVRKVKHIFKVNVFDVPDKVIKRFAKIQGLAGV